MSNDKAAYRQILKVTSIFGGIQFFNIIIGIIKTKAIAIFIGPAGVGIISVLNSTIDLIVRITSCGIETSSVREVASNEENLKQLSRIAQIINRVSFITGFIGFIITLLFSEKLSVLTFSNTDYKMLFQWVSISILIRQIINGKNSIFQGLRKVQDLAKANLYGSFLGLIISLPLYYFFKVDGIVPSIIAATIISYVIVILYSKKSISYLKEENVKFADTLKEGKEMIRLGLVLSLGGLMTILVSYLLQIYLSRNGGIEVVGYYNAGFTILNSYVGIIFTVMGTDYYPKLTTIIDDDSKIRKVVFEQIYTAVLLITPVIVGCIAFSSLIIKLLYSEEFLPISSMIVWGILGMLFKTVSWGIGYILIAKGDSKLFITNSVIFNIASLVLNIIGYYFWGLEGLGISFLIYYIIHFFAMRVIAKRKYGFYIEDEFNTSFLICVMICLISFSSSFISMILLKWIVMILLIVISMLYSYTQLDKKLNFKEIIASKFKK